MTKPDKMNEMKNNISNFKNTKQQTNISLVMSQNNTKVIARKNLKVLITDDHQMVRDGIRTMLESQKEKYDFVITEASSGEEALELVQKNKFDVVLMDYQMPGMNGSETTYEILIYKPGTKVLALSNYDEYTYVKNIIDSGALGYVLKNVSPGELVIAIETIMRGKLYYANDIAQILINNSGNRTKMGNIHLTKRELEVLKLIANEMSNKEIASKLHIEKRTVDAHRQNMLNKLNAKNTVSLVKLAIEYKLI